MLMEFILIIWPCHADVCGLGGVSRWVHVFMHQVLCIWHSAVYCVWESTYKVCTYINGFMEIYYANGGPGIIEMHGMPNCIHDNH